MNPLRHTPGPWQVISGSVYTDNAMADPVSIAHMDREELRTSPTERDANARLCAASPALALAARALVLWAGGDIRDEHSLQAIVTWFDDVLTKVGAP